MGGNPLIKENLNLTTKSLLRYPGGKSRAVSIILPYIPEGTTEICSPFFGGGSVELALMAKRVSIFGSDLFAPLVNFWQQVIKHPKELADRVQKYFPLSHTKFYTLQKEYVTIQNKLEQAAVFYVINRCSFSGIMTFQSGVSPGHPRFTQSSIDKLRNFRSIGLKVRKMDYKDSLRKYKNMMAYLDPPYLIENNNLYGYKGSLHKNFDHIKLAEILCKRGNWILSYNKCPQVEEMYSYAKILTPKWRHSMSKKKKVQELLIISPDIVK